MRPGDRAWNAKVIANGLKIPFRLEIAAKYGRAKRICEFLAIPNIEASSNKGEKAGWPGTGGLGTTSDPHHFTTVKDKAVPCRALQEAQSASLEIVALYFEEEEQLADPLRLRAFFQKRGVDYTVLLLVETSMAKGTVSQTQNWNAWPTTLFVAVTVW